MRSIFGDTFYFLALLSDGIKLTTALMPLWTT
jgi:hypothetical protein